MKIVVIITSLPLLAMFAAAAIITTTSPMAVQAQAQQGQQSPSSLSQQLQPQQEEEEEQQQNQAGATEVSIVSGSSSLTTDAFQPNPIQVSVGDTVTWTNDDSQPHTATSGQNAAPDGRFDSSIMAPGATFDFTFTEAGEYPYFCLLHPNQVGTVTVTAAGDGSESTSIGSNPTTASMGDDAAGGPLSELTEPFQDLFGSGDQTAGSSGSGSGTSPGSSTSSSSSSPSSSGGSRCPDGFHRSPSGDCERVTDTRGMPRCPDGYHRSPSGNCEYVG
jgi:plastocyanin